MVDLPGAYSMSPFTSEESVTSSYVKNENPDVIINIVDATNLRTRSLFFYNSADGTWDPGCQYALNKSDLTDKKKTEINVKKLEEKLGYSGHSNGIYSFRARWTENGNKPGGRIKRLWTEGTL